MMRPFFSRIDVYKRQDQLHQMQDLVSSFPSGGVKLVDIQRLADDILDCHAGI